MTPRLTDFFGARLGPLPGQRSASLVNIRSASFCTLPGRRITPRRRSYWSFWCCWLQACRSGWPLPVVSGVRGLHAGILRMGTRHGCVCRGVPCAARALCVGPEAQCPRDSAAIV